MAKAAATKVAKEKTTRFLGWQNTPIQQASFGRTTQGGKHNTKFLVKHSTGSVQAVEPQWYVLDASEAPIGRLASTIAVLLSGKHRATFTPGAGSGDFVAVINADKAYFTSDKAEKKIYYWHTRYMGGLKSESARHALERRPEEVIWEAVQGMLPKNKLSRYQLAHLKIYKGSENPHAAAQKTVALSLKKDLLKRLI
jgi:large subunit ribosomal protein L13